MNRLARLIAALLLAAGMFGCARVPSGRVLVQVAPHVEKSSGQIRVSSSPGRLLAGASKKEITPAVGTTLAGYSRRANKPSEGVHDPLWVRAVAFGDGEDLVFILSADILVIPPGFTQEVARRIDQELPGAVGPEDLMISATHTHSGPGAYLMGPIGQMTAGKYRPEVLERLMAACAQAAIEAAGRMRPAQFAVGHAQIPEAVENRMDPKAPVDPELIVLEWKGVDGEPIAALLNYAAHPTLLSSKNLLISGDFPGAACRALEKLQPGAVGLFINGASGDLRPQHIGGLHNFELAEFLGNLLAEKGLQALKDAAWKDHVEVASWGGVFPLPPVKIGGMFFKIPHWLAQQWVPDRALFTMIALNEAVLVSVPADLSGEIGLQIKRWLSSRGLDGVVFGYTNDYLGYIVPPELFKTKVYEARMAFHGPAMGPVLEAIVSNLAEEYLVIARRRASFPSAARVGLPVVVLEGDAYARGLAHGSRYRAQVRASVANILHFVEQEAPPIPFLRAGFVRWRLTTYFDQMKPHIPKDVLEEMRGLADGSGVPLPELERVHALPEIASVWCSNSAVYGPATRDGRLIHLRNLDWAIHSDAQRYSAIFVHRPAQGHAYASVGFFGFVGVLSGVNDAGISVGQVGAQTIDKTIRGVPMPFLLRDILLHTGDLETAVQKVQKAPRTSGFHYLFADALRKKAVALETTRKHCAVFWAGDEEARNVPYAVPIASAIVRADPALDPTVRNLQRCAKGDPSRPGLEPPGGKAYDVRYRQHSLMIQERYGQWDPERMIEVAKAIAPPSNVHSIIFAFPQMWVATAEGGARAADQPYVRYDLDSYLKTNPEKTTAPSS
ncbi:MAG: neutral/alkaline non-lysosomal ceramidase N-terminal domain-containing protein [Candidatus Omnitrophica bacterium]|nr:neutral/alkaline non-lysosomal ceramidase N-terminal domain-containing protein [Candidatus Omnitrophota bacterium]